ncbi:extracellular solute-binding protein [Clostridium fallax]|uniref:extracellular solute-binding protein n=1 Tax=Clostridium fallax TaxID=1533 RepID=UPI000934CC76
MSKRTKLFAMVMASTFMVGALYGCGSSDKKATEDKKLLVWSHLTQQEVDKIKPLAEKWGKENNVDVELVIDKGEMQAYIQAANSSKGPDVMFGMPHDNLGTYEKAGLLAEVPSGTINKDDYVSNQVVDSVTIGEKQYAVPLAQETTALFYNKEKVKEVPKTMENLIEEAKNVGFKYDINNFYNSFSFIAADGGYVYKNNNGTLDPNDIGLNNEGAIKGFQFIQDLVTKYKFMPADINGDLAKGEFSSGKDGFYISGPWDISTFKETGIDFGVSPLPKMNGKETPSFMGVQTAFVSSKSKKQDLGWKFIKDMAKESSDVLINVGSRIPVLKSALESDAYKENPYMQAFVEQAKHAIPMPNIPEVQAMWQPAADNLKLLTSGQIDAKQCADNIVEQIKQGIAQQK